MTADALSPYALPLRREGDAAIVDATGETVLVIDPDRHLEDDENAAQLADRVFACLTAAPVREEGGAVPEGRWVYTSACPKFDGNSERVKSYSGSIHAGWEDAPEFETQNEFYEWAKAECDRRNTYEAKCRAALATREEAPAEAGADEWVALERLADEATPGDWRVAENDNQFADGRHVFAKGFDGSDFVVLNLKTDHTFVTATSREQQQKNALFAAAANPAVIKRLIFALRAQSQSRSGEGQ